MAKRRVNQDEVESIIAELPPLQLTVGRIPVSISPASFLRPSNEAQVVCTGCVSGVRYGEDGKIDRVVIEWLDPCKTQEKTTFFDNLNDGHIAAALDAQNNCKSVTVHFTVQDGKVVKVLGLLANAKDRRCCPKFSGKTPEGKFVADDTSPCDCV